MPLVRSTIFFSVYIIATLAHSALCVIVLPLLPFRIRFRFAVLLNRFVVWWYPVSCGVRYHFEGFENLPRDGVGVLLSNHQSEWETFYLQTVVSPLCTVLKKELLRIPFFGWALGMLRPIAIDRGLRTGTVKQIQSQGRERLASGAWVLIFPEGTRVPYGSEKRFSKTGALLAVEAGVPLIPIVHDAGALWPGKQFLKRPGDLHLTVGPKIETLGKTVDEVHLQASQWMRAEMNRLAEIRGGAALKADNAV